MAQRLKHLPAMQETWVQSLAPEDPLEKKMATHSSILAWRIPRTEEPGATVHRVAKSRTRLRDFTIHYIIRHVLRAFPPGDQTGPYTEQAPMRGLPPIRTHSSDFGLIGRPSSSAPQGQPQSRGSGKYPQEACVSSTALKHWAGTISASERILCN